MKKISLTIVSDNIQLKYIMRNNIPKINESLSDKYLNYLYVKDLKDRPGTIYVPVSPESGLPLFKDVSEP